MTLANLALNGFFWSVVDKLINQTLGIIVVIFLANRLGPESFGLIGMLAVFILLSESLVNTGFSQALIQRSEKVTERDTSTVFYANLAISILLYCVLYVAAPAIADFYDEPKLVAIARVLFLVVIVNAFTVVTRAKLTIRIDFKSQAIANSAATVVSAIVAFLFVYLELGYWALVGLTLARALVVAIGFWWLCDWKPSWIFCQDSFRKLFRFGSNLMIAGVVATTVNNLYVILIGRYFGSVHVGYFTQAANLTNSLSGLIGSILQGVTYPILTSVNEDPARMIAIYKQLIQVTMLISLPCMLGFAIIADLFTEIFLGSQWASMVPILVLLSIARLITPISAINMNILNAVGRSDLFLRVDLVKLPMIIVGLIIAVPFGIEAVAVALLVNSAVSFFINAYYPGRMFGFGAFAQIKVAYKMILASLAMIPATRFVVFESAVFELLVKIVVAAVVYVLVLLIFREQSVLMLAKRLGDKVHGRLKA